MEIELLELIAELSMSEDKSRQALGAEIKRLFGQYETKLVQYQTANDELQADRERLANELETCRASLDSLVDRLR